MKKSIIWIVSILLLFGFTAGAYFWATSLIDSNFGYRSQLKDNPPQPGEALGEPVTGRLVFVLIDALRYDTSQKTDVMPTLNQMRELGASALMHSQPPSFSEPGYSTLLTGAWPEMNDGPTFNLDYEEIPTFTQDNLFSAAHRSGWKTAISGYYWFEKLVPQEDVDLSFYTPGEDNAADMDVMKAALPWLKNNEAQLVLIHLDQVDYAGHHEGGPQSPNWDAAAARTDAMLAEVVSTLDFSRDTLVVLSDHGQIDAGGHGGQDPVCLLEPFIMVGKGIIPGIYPDIQMVDVAPTLAALLGVNLPASTQGDVLTEMLTLSDSVTTALPEATRSQQTGLITAYAESFGTELSTINMPDSSEVSDYQQIIHDLRIKRLFSDRFKRSLPTAAVIAVAVLFLLRQRKNGALSWIIGGGAFLALFNLRYAVLDGRVYSLSSIISQTELIVYIATTTAAVFFIIWLAVNLINKTFRGSPNQNGMRTLYLGFTVLFFASLPVLASYLLNGALVTWTLPDYLTSFFCLIGLIQILVISGLTPVLAALAALITKLGSEKK